MTGFILIDSIGLQRPAPEQFFRTLTLNMALLVQEALGHEFLGLEKGCHCIKVQGYQNNRGCPVSIRQKPKKLLYFGFRS